MAFPCGGCGSPNTQYQIFSGGREYFCHDCDYGGAYPEEHPDLPRATLLRTKEGRIALYAQLDQELARLKDEGQI